MGLNRCAPILINQAVYTGGGTICALLVLQARKQWHKEYFKWISLHFTCITTAVVRWASSTSETWVTYNSIRCLNVSVSCVDG